MIKLSWTNILFGFFAETNSRNGLCYSSPMHLPVQTPKIEKYTYDKNRNPVRMKDIWSGQKVSELEMSYDKKGFMTTIQRKSEAAKMIQYFLDRILKATYNFY
ncbi:hypothetical protein [Chryseobacterium joostei]|uniref:hypothetical protein n=1 Tax=Chryseobacterium joostei TaxID=112234 RepID=UPI003D13FD2A